MDFNPRAGQSFANGNARNYRQIIASLPQIMTTPSSSPSSENEISSEGDINAEKRFSFRRTDFYVKNEDNPSLESVRYQMTKENTLVISEGNSTPLTRRIRKMRRNREMAHMHHARGGHSPRFESPLLLPWKPTHRPLATRHSPRRRQTSDDDDVIQQEIRFGVSRDENGNTSTPTRPRKNFASRRLRRYEKRYHGNIPVSSLSNIFE